jgi:hypothetical protein
MDIIEIVKAALKNVPSNYYVVHNPEERNGHITGYSKDLTQAEQSFVARFYHEIMKIFESSPVIKDYIEHYKMDTELYKRIIYSYSSENQCYNKTRKKYITEKSKGVYPDFVFHKGQEFNKKEDQLLSIEFKAKPISEEDFEYDLFKVNLYIEELNFQHGAYVVVNNNNKRVQELFGKYRGSNFYNAQKCKVICRQDFKSDILVLE